MMGRRAVVAMSGGVDSSVAAALMKEAGYEVTGIMLKLWKGAAANNESGCCSIDAAEDARRVAQVLDIPFYVFNFADYFSNTVIARFTEEYSRGRTPNPCVECNRMVKFSALLERAKAFDADVLATGHYARVDSSQNGFRLLRGRDRKKDQSYVLYMLGQDELARVRFPVGEFPKDEVREIASTLALRTAAKPESQEICFVPNGDIHSFLAEAVPEGSLPGAIVNVAGERVGTHRGFAHYTRGQRRGLGVSVGVPLYVRESRARDNVVVVDAEGAIQAHELDLEDVTFVSGKEPKRLHASVATRYRGPEATATISQGSGGGEERVWTVTFDEPSGIAAPGQAAVFYDGEEVIGGGTIRRVR
jgi:tRNA-specific 2-thiouridylase